MAYFERKDEESVLIVCNICNVKCAERSMTTHKATCSQKPNHRIKFENGSLQKCPHVNCHIVERGMMDLHLEFCTKRQDILVSEFQEASRSSDTTTPIESNRAPDNRVDYGGHDWNRDANGKHFVANFAKLKVK